MHDLTNDTGEPPLSRCAIRRAISLSYVQAILGSIYVASTGGMFITGYALKLGANNQQIGMLGTVPMFCVVVQLLASIFIERGTSRRRLTIAAALFSVSGWAFIATLPHFFAGTSSAVQVSVLILGIAAISLFAQISACSRASWVGDLIPSEDLGTFFGRMTMYGGMIGTVFALVGGTFLDHVKSMGINAFTWLFFFGMFCGLINTSLYFPQTDVPVAKHEAGGKLSRLVAETFANRPFMILMIYALIWQLQTMATPFYPAYMLRDLKMPFLGVGMISVTATLAVLLSSPFWGRIVDRYGCRPVLIACTFVAVLLPLPWIWMTTATAVYYVIPVVNLVGGFAGGGITVALSTLLYKITPSAGRSMQFAIYSVIVVLIASPMPIIGGHLPGWLEGLGIHTDLRCTFYFGSFFCFMAALVAQYINEPNALQASDLIRNLPAHMREPKSLSNDE